MRIFKTKYCLHYLLSLLLLELYITEATAQVVPEQQYNRFQYHTFKWRTYHSEDYHVYFPYGYDSLCKYVATELPEAMERIKHRMVTGLLNPPNVIIYPSVNQLYESNIGMYDMEDKTLPTFVATGNRMVLFFNGSHEDLKKQMYEALVRAIWTAQIKAGIEEQANNNNSKIPFWFTEGAIRFFAHHWPVQAEDELRRSFENNDFHNWQEVIAYQPRLSGQAFCYFLTDRFYEQSVQQLYAQLKKKKDLRRSIRLIAKRELDSLYTLSFDYYKGRFKEVEQTARNANEKTITIPHKKGVIKNVATNAEQNTVTYISSHNNTRTIYTYNVNSKKTTKVTRYKLPPWINDYSKDDYPLLKQEGNSIQLTYPKKKEVVVANFSTNGGRLSETAITGIDGITNIQYQDRGDFILSGNRKGQSDIVKFNSGRGRYEPFTNDIYDDNYLAEGINNGLFFLSQRPVEQETDSAATILEQGIYKVSGKNVNKLVADTIPYIRWDKPILTGNNELLATHTLYCTERFAIVNTTNGSIKTLGKYTSIQYQPSNHQIATFQNNGDSIIITHQAFKEWVNANTSTDKSSIWLRDYQKRARLRAEEDSLINASKSEYSFLKDILIAKDAKEQDAKRQDSIDQSLEYHPKKVKRYILQLHSAYFSAKANNDYFINRYQPFLNYQGQFKFPEIGAMLQAGFTDLFENHHIGIGFRIPTQTEGSDFFVNYRNTKKKLDWGLTYFRKVETVQPDPQRLWVNESGLPYPNLAKVKTHYYELSLRYPITYYLSVGFDQAFRNDRTIFLSADKYSLLFEDIKSLWSISTISVKQNKLKPTIPLLYKGYNATAFIDGFKAFTQNGDGLYGLSVKAEYHLPIYRYITLVAKGQAGHSGGAANILYNVAGLDNNVTVKVDSTVHFPQGAPYAFQSLITPFRGYRQNSLFGNQYAVFNADVYFPIFQTLIPIETPLSFINLLQLGIFTDIGTAKETWQQPEIKQGWLQSYGFSARSKLAGYPIRLDIAWPGTFSKKPLLYFSLSM